MLFAAVLLVAAGCARELEIIDIQDETPVDVIEETPQVTVIRAGFENPETKTSIQLTQDGSAAKVLWTAGDKIMLYGIAGDVYYKKVFSTEMGGVSSAEFSCSDWNPNGKCTSYVAFYPSDQVEGFGLTQIGVVIPPEQTAVADGIAEKLNISYSSAESISEHFTFRNIPALIKFSLKGDLIPSLDHIKFIANINIAGEAVLSDLDADNPTYNLNSWYGDDRVTPTNIVKLSKPAGGFVASDDDNTVSYYIAVYPGTTNGFSMAFFNEEGEYVTKYSTKTMELVRSQITDLGTINVGNSFGDSSVRQYMTKTGNAKPVDIVVIPDGFTSGERSSFESLAQAGIDFMFNTAPYNNETYKNYFNVYFIWVPSKESGASITDGDGKITEAHDTAFGSRWGEDSYGDMTADEDKVYGFVSAHCPEILKGDLNINEVPILMIINDDRYGGIAHTYSTGRTYCQVPYVGSGNLQYWSFKPKKSDTDEAITDNNFNSHIINTPQSVFNDIYGVGNNSHAGTWLNVLLHEFGGHSFGRLGDEYWKLENGYPSAQSAIRAHTYQVPFALNVSGYYNTLPEMWASLMNKKADLVARNGLYGRIGKYQGADTYIFNRWRSEMISCMYDNRQYFSTLQRALIAKRISDLAGVQFDLDAFLLTDDPRDPLRDGSLSASNNVNVRGPIMVRPMLPPPVIIDDTPVEIQLMDE